MNTLRVILSLWFALALLASDGHAQDLSEAVPLPEGIAATGDTTEVRALIAWAEEYRATYPDQARQTAERALMLARSLDDLLGIGSSSMILGSLAPTLREAEVYFTAAREAFEQIQNDPNLFHALVNLGDVQERRGHSQQALSLIFEALEGFKLHGDIEGQARALNNIGNAHKNQANWEEALMYFQQAFLLMEPIDEHKLKLLILNNIGLVLSELGRLEEAEAALLQALEISEQQEAPFETAFTSNNLGFVLNQQGYHERALPFLLRAESLSSEIVHRILLSAVYDELGKAFLGLGQYDRALHYATESLTLMEEANGDLWYLMLIHQTLSQIHEATGNTEEAFNHYRQYATIRDSVFNVEKAELITEMQTRYETEENRRTIERLEQEAQIQTLRQTLLIVSVASLLLLLVFLYYRYRVKQRANRLLEELDAAKSRFFANISHEFRTPLTVILGGLQDGLTGRFGTFSEKLVNRDQALLRNTRQLQRLIDEVLDLNRLEAGYLDLRISPGDLVLTIKHIVEANAPLAERNGIALKMTCDIESSPRLYDEEKLEKIVGNLLSNALKFTPQNGSVHVDLRCKDLVEISVTDEGPGIPPEAQAKVFERFSQLDHGVLHGGTGIGLALVKELTDLHGGNITLKSTLGEGSTFIVRLPLEKSNPIALQDEKDRHRSSIKDVDAGGDGHSTLSSTEWALVPDSETDRTTILIIEDNDDVRAYVHRSLEDTYRILEARNGQKGLQQAKSALPDLIVSDVMLPDLDGYEIARQLKGAPDTACIPVVMLTARAAESDHVAGYDSGAEAYITKPFSPETLRAVIARLLQERLRLRRQLQAETKQLSASAPQNSPPTLADRAREIILENLHDDSFGIDDLASSLHVTRQTLYNRFKAELSSSPSDFVRTIRLERAHELLLEGVGSVSEVAYAVGFKSMSHFTRSFRDHYGILPSSLSGTRVDRTG